MKKGFFLLTALAALYSHNSYGNKSVDQVNRSLKNCNPKGGGGKPSKHVWQTMHKKMKDKKIKNRIVKHSRNINHKKVA